MQAACQRTSGPSSGSEVGRHRLAYWTLAIALIYGGFLRLIWIEDMEWKEDEQWSYRMSQEIGRVQPWPLVGMPTSLGIANPGPSVWVFVAIGRVASSPTSMARAIALLNILGLFAFAATVRFCLPSAQREPWLWGVALEAVSPFAIRMSRKIWAQSILTPLVWFLWISHRYRRTRWGALTWGLAGALIGQVHLSGWFVAAGLVIGTVVAEWRGGLPRMHTWLWWLLGSLLGLSSAVPWALNLPTLPLSLPVTSVAITIQGRVIACLYGLAAASLGMLPFLTLGLGSDQNDFMVGPKIQGIRTHVGDGLAWLILLLVAATVVVRLVGEVLVPGFRYVMRNVASGVGNRPGSPRLQSGEPSGADEESASTGFYLWSTIAIPCTMFICIINVFFYHYFFVMCPFVFVLLAVCLLPWRRALLLVVIAQALLSMAFLSYIHHKGGTLNGDYGLTYARQQHRHAHRSW
jgi:hypothetical protein